MVVPCHELNKTSIMSKLYSTINVNKRSKFSVTVDILSIRQASVWRDGLPVVRRRTEASLQSINDSDRIASVIEDGLAHGVVILEAGP